MLALRQAATRWVAVLNSGRAWRFVAVAEAEKTAMNVEARSLMGLERKISWWDKEVLATAQDGDVPVGEGGDSERGRLRDMIPPVSCWQIPLLHRIDAKDTHADDSFCPRVVV